MQSYKRHITQILIFTLLTINTTSLEICMYGLLGTIICRLFYIILIYARLALYKDKQPNEHTDLLSVVVCFHNEVEQLHLTTSTLVDQDSQNIEYILVDDKSTDHTLELLKAYQSNHISIVQNKEASHGKKLALSKGLEQAKGEWVLLTDADCIVPTQWASTMRGHIGQNEIVLGYAPLNIGNSLVGRFSRFEAFYTAVQYLSYAIAGIPYMGVGRNLLYRKKLHNQYQDQMHPELASGDDDLLVNAAAQADKTTICLDPNSFVYSDPKDTWRSFIRQKTRHISTSHHYRWFHKLLLGLASLSHMTMYLLAFILLIMGQTSCLGYLLAFYVIMWLIYWPICRRLEAQDLWLFLPAYDLAMALYYIVMIPFTFKRKPEWS